MRYSISAFLAVLAFVPSPAFADLKAGELSDQLNASGARKEVAVAYLTGLYEGFSWSDAHIDVVWQKRLFCVPEKLNLVSDQLVQIFIERVRKEPDERDHLAGGVLLYALRGTFPCKA